jgi:hypothetical protein
MNSWLSDDQIHAFLQKQDLDVRISHNARWLDQKCTPDLVSVVADCVLQSEHAQTGLFVAKNIWLSDYTQKYIPALFKKPKVTETLARSEYDKFFAQPLELLAYSGVLRKEKRKKRNYYAIANKPLLAFIARSEQSALKFLCTYINAVLVRSGLWNHFERFFISQTDDSFHELKEAFVNFTIENTPINNRTECGRIFQKVLNPLSYQRDLLGSKSGRISKNEITWDMLLYNRPNFRDMRTDKAKSVTRKAHELNTPLEPVYAYESQKAKRTVRQYNEAFRKGISEMPGDENLATQIHHIFPESQFPAISGYYENLIALTPNQHSLQAHPKNHTYRIDREYQRLCLNAKSNTIALDMGRPTQQQIYSFDRFKEVLAVGLGDVTFLEVPALDLDQVRAQIDAAYRQLSVGAL